VQFSRRGICPGLLSAALAVRALVAAGSGDVFPEGPGRRVLIARWPPDI
jgi:hypothetical protein